MQKLVILILTLLTYSLNINAQGSLSAYCTVGNNYIENTYVEIDAIGAYKYDNWNFSLGVGLTTAPNHTAYFHALLADASHQFDIPKFPMRLTCKYLFNPHTYSGIREHDWAIIVSYIPKHFDVELGYLIRYNHAANTGYGEYFNVLYNFAGYIWSRDNYYNIRISLKNFDNLYFGRSTDIMLDIKLSYAYPRNVSYFIQGQCRAAGIGNIQFNHFDCKVRGGIIWEI
ncbi:MAG: hypothetical protein EOL95_03615 [Bacteroidia bacterium]|nr:hypothetical protein [Bacteroidia bacterium]